MLRVAIVGHRIFGAPDIVRFVADECERLLSRAKRTDRDVIALSATAEGADTVFAEAAVSLDIPLEIVRPFDGYSGDFLGSATRDRYRALQAAARSETRLAYRERSEQAYLAAMRWVTDGSDVLGAAWDGRPALGLGGTGNAVGHARRTGRPVIHIDVVNRTVVPDLDTQLLR
jgi:hypothetical protein